MLLPVGALTSLAVWLVAPLLAPRDPAPEERARLFLADAAPLCAPEGLEQTRYQLAVVLPVLLFGLGAVLVRRVLVRRASAAPHRWLAYTALGAQVLVSFACAAAWVYERVRGFRYFQEERAVWVILMAVALFLLSRSDRARTALRSVAVRLRSLAWMPYVLSGALTLVLMLTCVFTDETLERAHGVVTYHMDFTMGEFAAALNGRVPLVDFFSQYQNVLPLLLTPWFRLVGFDVTTFTLTMCALSCLGFALVFTALRRVAGSGWQTAALYVPFLATSLRDTDRTGDGASSNPFNYYAVGPLRYFAVFLLAAGVAWYLNRPGRGRLAVIAAIGALAVINNPDFGVAAAAGVLTVGMLVPPGCRRGGLDLGARLLALALCVGAATLAVATYAAAIRLSAGQWPTLGLLTTYPRVFARYGFMMLAMPPLGMYWVVFATFIAAALLAVHEALSESGATMDPEARVTSGLLAYAGVSGLGALFYYVGRSHPHVLVSVFPAWAFALVLLMRRAWVTRVRNAPSTSTRFVTAFPVASLFVLSALIGPTVVDLPNPLLQIHRLRPARSEMDPGSGKAEPAAVPHRGDIDRAKMVSSHVPPGAPTLIIYPGAHWIALRAGVENVFPFAHGGSLLLGAQIDAVLSSLDRLPAQGARVFGRLPTELSEGLRRSGFTRQDEVLGDFAVWSRNAPQPTAKTGEEEKGDELEQAPGALQRASGRHGGLEPSVGSP